MLFAFGAALTSSGEHRTLTSIGTAQKSITQQIVAQLENANPPLYLSCAPVSAYQTGGSNAVTFTNLPSGYSAQITGVSYWDAGFTFTPNQAQCVANSPQLISATLTYPSGGSSVVTAVVDNPTPPTPPSAGDASQLVFYVQPGGALSGQNLSPQPVVEIEDAAGNVVTTDLSDVVLTLNAGNGATLSNNCIGSENYGVISFSGCSVLKDGHLHPHGDRRLAARRADDQQHLHRLRRPGHAVGLHATARWRRDGRHRLPDPTAAHPRGRRRQHGHHGHVHGQPRHHDRHSELGRPRHAVRLCAERSRRCRLLHRLHDQHDGNQLHPHGHRRRDRAGR